MVESQLAEDRAKKTMIDTARLAGRPLSMDVDMMRSRMIVIVLILNIADELRAEQENANSCEKNRRALEFKVDNLYKNICFGMEGLPWENLFEHSFCTGERPSSEAGRGRATSYEGRS